jgi:hypothetical protein
MGLIKALIGNIKRRLKILEPITLPIAISLFFLTAAIIEVTSSGKDVPAAIIVRP